MADPDDWFVPGGAFGVEWGGVMRLRPPPHWRRVILRLDRTPPSMNTNQLRSSWQGYHREKRSWQEEIGLLLMAARVERGTYRRAVAGAFLRFPRRAARRDTPNYGGLVTKALGDALVVSDSAPAHHRYIPDDDADHYVFGGIEFEQELGPARTSIHIFFQPKEG